jgi:hypothetical protein
MRFSQALELAQANLDKILSQVGDKSGERETVEGVLNVVCLLFQRVLDTCKGPPCSLRPSTFAHQPPRLPHTSLSCPLRLSVNHILNHILTVLKRRRILQTVTVERRVTVVRDQRRFGF